MAVFDTPIAVLIVIHAPIKREERVNDVYELGFLDGSWLMDKDGRFRYLYLRIYTFQRVI